MRKRIVIAAIVLLTGGGIAFLVFSPWESRLEYHIRGYKDAEQRFIGKKTFIRRAWEGWREIRGKPVSESENWRDLMQHERALIGLGYLEERIFSFSSVPLSNVSHAINSAARKTSTTRDFFHAAMSGTNGIRVVTMKGNMPTMEAVQFELMGRTNK